MSRRPRSLKILKLATLAAAIALALFGARHATAYQIFTPNPAGTGANYTRNSPPTAQPPFLHWDLRQFANCSIPWSVTFRTALPTYFDVNLDGIDNDAADQAAARAALASALKTWTDVAPATIRLELPTRSPSCSSRRSSFRIRSSSP